MSDDNPAPCISQRNTLLATGTSDSVIRRAMENGALRRVRRGAYVTADQDMAVPAWDRHALLVVATAPKLASGAVVSHVSAAALHGLALWPPPPDRVHISRDGSCGGGRRTRTLHVHVGPLPVNDVVWVEGIAVTSVARTIVDIARTQPFEAGVVTADQGLHAGLVDGPALVKVFERQLSLAGSGRARAVLAFADGLSESVGESRSRVAILRVGLPTPVLQHRICSPEGRFVGRADFAYVAQRVVGEFDGRSKYHLGFANGVQPMDVIVAERRRADAMERAGWTVVRWMWDDIAVPSTIARKFRRALDLRGPAI